MSDWSDYSITTPTDTPAYQVPSDSYWTPDPSAEGGDTLYTYEPAAREIMSMTDAVAGFVGANVGGGKYEMFAQPAPTPTGEESKAAAAATQSKSFWDRLMNADPRVQAAALTVGMGALSGLGAGYIAGKKQEEANKIAQGQLDVNRELAKSQEALNAAKTSQNLGSLQFQQPAGIIGRAQQPWQPAPFVSPARRVSL